MFRVFLLFLADAIGPAGTVLGSVRAGEPGADGSCCDCAQSRILPGFRERVGAPPFAARGWQGRLHGPFPTAADKSARNARYKVFGSQPRQNTDPWSEDVPLREASAWRRATSSLPVGFVRLNRARNGCPERCKPARGGRLLDVPAGWPRTVKPGYKSRKPKRFAELQPESCIDLRRCRLFCTSAFVLISPLAVGAGRV